MNFSRYKSVCIFWNLYPITSSLYYSNHSALVYDANTFNCSVPNASVDFLLTLSFLNNVQLPALLRLIFLFYRDNTAKCSTYKACDEWIRTYLVPLLTLLQAHNYCPLGKNVLSPDYNKMWGIRTEITGCYQWPPCQHELLSDPLKYSPFKHRVTAHFVCAKFIANFKITSVVWVVT